MSTPLYPSRPRSGERGSVLIYIFIAIIVLAALTFAVSSSNREGVTTVDRERSELQATQILDYTGMIRRSVQAMKVDGITDNELCFHHALWGYATYNHTPACNETENQVFTPNGGGSSFQNPGEALMDVAFNDGRPRWGQWHFLGSNPVTGVGTASPDLLLVLPYIRREICLALNKKLDIGDVIPSDDANFDVNTLYDGTFSTVATLNAPALNGKRSGCFQANTTPAGNPYIYFAVLSAR
ncbi:MAG: hypothetical protein ACXW4B_09315 [Micavibrio sp.]